MKRALSEIQPTPSPHIVGQKRVLVAADESGCAITQIAVSDLKTGEAEAAHVHYCNM
ncbi:MAG: hypothetical protein J5644_00265 [Bacteroidales bacterium]|nr:hypothetical protein [Bacteroidales bacterium]